MSLSVPKPQVSLGIKVMHFRGGELEELKGKCPWGQGGKETVLICLSKPVPPSVLGEYDKPSLSAWPSPVVPSGKNVTLRCHSDSPFKTLRLYKRDRTGLSKLQGYHPNPFTIGPVTREHAGSYTCSGAYSSAHSDPLQIVVIGRRGPAQPAMAEPASNPTLGPHASAPKAYAGFPARSEPKKDYPV